MELCWEATHKSQRAGQLNLDFLEITAHDLYELDAPFSEEEIKQAVMAAPTEKAPGPDGYTRLFFKRCWDTIRADLVPAIQQVYQLRGQHLPLLNSANITLLAKGDDPAAATDYWPISLIHSFSKLVSKIMANWLAPLLPSLISPCQSAFIKGRSIQDNFQYVQGADNHFHKNKTPMLFLKLDIAKAFDSVHWDYILEVLHKLGFGQRWRDILSILWGTTSL